MLVDFLATLADYAAQNAWMEDSLCSQVDPEVFFPEKGGSPAEAKKVCARCPVRAECLQRALDSDETLVGVWGGTTETQRRRMLRKARRLGMAA